MKKLSISVAILVALVFSCFTFTACSGAGNYDGKEYLLEEISATYDETVSQEAKTAQETIVNLVKTRIASENKPFCRFYEKTYTVLTDCNGFYRFTEYEVIDGKIDTANPHASNPWASPDPIDFSRPSLDGKNTASLRNVDFSMEYGKLVLTEKNDGITVRYVFGKSGKVDQSAKIDTDKIYSLQAITYCPKSDKEAANSAVISAYNEKQKTAWETDIKFISDEKCKIGDAEYSFKLLADSNAIAVNVGQLKIDGVTYNSRIQIYGDILIISPTTPHNPGCLYYVAAKPSV